MLLIFFVLNFTGREPVDFNKMEFRRVLLETPSGFAIFNVREDVFCNPRVCPNTLVMNHLFSFFLVPCNGSLNPETDKFFPHFCRISGLILWIYLMHVKCSISENSTYIFNFVHC